MNRIFLAAASACLLFMIGCEQKATETKSEEAKLDSAKTEMAVKVSKPQLTGKALLVAKQWNASEFETNNIKLSGDLVDLKYNFKADSSFDFTSDGKKESGTWKINEEGTKLKLIYSTAREADYDIKKLSENIMIIAGKEHDMFRTITLVPQKQ